MTDQELIFDLCKMPFGVHFAQLIVCQAIHETANFTSENLRRNNNYFGYSHVKGGRWQLPIQNGEHDRSVYYAGYATRENSVMEIIDWYHRRMKEGFFKNFKRITIENFCEDLKKANYYEDTEAHYFNGVKSAYIYNLEPGIRSDV